MIEHEVLSPRKSSLEHRLENRRSTIGIVGLGYVGIPLALRFNEVGFKVLGLETNGEKVKRLNAGESYIAHIDAEKIQTARRMGFEATEDFSRAKEADALIICVPTPLTKQRDPDLSFVVAAIEALAPHLRPEQVISLESTTYPGTTEEVLVPRLEQRGFKLGHDMFVVFSPEREDPGNGKFSTRTIPKVVGGHTPACQRVGNLLYQLVVDQIVPVSSTKTAEMVKLLENIHRAVNIGLVNEMKIVADSMGIDIHEVIRAASTKPFGFTPYYPGPGLGGHCIPIDPFYLTWKAREYGVNTRFIELAGEVNTAMPHWVVSKVADALNERQLSLKGSRILMLGLAYKKNVDDMRESPSLELMHLLEQRGAKVSYCDPWVPSYSDAKRKMTSLELHAQMLGEFECVLIATNHDIFDYNMVREHAQLIVDTRGVFLEPSHKVVRA